MAIDDETNKASLDYEAGNASTDFTAMSKTAQEKQKYIRKEQMHRQKLLDEESQNYLQMTYPADNRGQSLSMQSTMTETDFTDRDWTPEDSSYGAAFPFCGWVPKSLRQGVEKAIIALVGLFVIYLIVSIAMILKPDNPNSSGYKTDDFYITDDDFYVTNDNVAYDDDDDDDDYLR